MLPTAPVVSLGAHAAYSTGSKPVPSVFGSGDRVHFKLTLRPAGCSKILQKIRGGLRKTRGVSGIIYGGHPTNDVIF